MELSRLLGPRARDAAVRMAQFAASFGADEALRASRDPRYLDRIDAVRAEANQLGVTGIPTFVFGDLDDEPLAVVGCQQYEVLARAAERAGARRRNA